MSEHTDVDLKTASLRALKGCCPACGEGNLVRTYLKQVDNCASCGEAFGQITRLALAPLGHVLGRTPWGNSGRATESKFARAPSPDDVSRLYSQAGIKVTGAMREASE